MLLVLLGVEWIECDAWLLVVFQLLLSVIVLIAISFVCVVRSVASMQQTGEKAAGLLSSFTESSPPAIGCIAAATVMA